MNNTMDHITSVLRSKIDFSHTKFDEERGEVDIDKAEESDSVALKRHQDSLLPVLQPTAGSTDGDLMVVVEKGKKADRNTVQKLVDELDKFVTPFECYQMMMITKQKQEEEDRLEADRRKREEGDGPKKMFSHHDPSVNREPVFDVQVNIS